MDAFFLFAHLESFYNLFSMENRQRFTVVKTAVATAVVLPSVWALEIVKTIEEE